MQSPAAIVASQNGRWDSADMRTPIIMSEVIFDGNVVFVDPANGTSKLKMDFTSKEITNRPITNNIEEYNGFL